MPPQASLFTTIDVLSVHQPSPGKPALASCYRKQRCQDANTSSTEFAGIVRVALYTGSTSQCCCDVKVTLLLLLHGHAGLLLTCAMRVTLQQPPGKSNCRK